MGKDQGLCLEAGCPGNRALWKTVVHILVFAPYPMTDYIFQNVLCGGRRGSEQHPKLPAQHPPYILGEASPDCRSCPLSRAGVSYLGAGSCCPAKTTFHLPPEDQSLSSAEPWETPRFKFIFLIFLKLLFISNTTSSPARQYELNPETVYGV